MLTKKTYIVRCTEEDYSKICQIINHADIMVTDERKAALISKMSGELSEVKKKMLMILLTDPEYEAIYNNYTAINVTALAKKVGISQSSAACAIGDLVISKILEKDYISARVKHYRLRKQTRDFLLGK